MEKAIEMMTEYLLERCPGLESENRIMRQKLERMEEQNASLAEQNVKFLDHESEMAKKLAELAKLINPLVRWKDGNVYLLVPSLGEQKVGRIVELLDIKENYKACL